jgi:hypothetical protein
MASVGVELRVMAIGPVPAVGKVPARASSYPQPIT